MFLINSIRNFYGRFEHSVSSLFLIGGFILDAFTLKRVDSIWENAFIAGYLIIIGTFILLVHIKENHEGDERDPSKAHFWYVNILQFAFGGIFSAFLILYFRSADILVAWPFIALLALIFIANEFLKKHYVRLSFQISLFFLSIYWFMIFLIPVLLRKIGAEIFILSGVVSLALILLFIFILFYFTSEKFTKSKRLIFLLISGVIILVNFLYFTNLIPPIPLSLKDAGVYHSIEKNKEGNYAVTYEKYRWTGYFDLYPDFNQVTGAPVYAFSAIFSPKKLDIRVNHEWQHYSETSKEWLTESVINLPVVGGRDGGFRTYSARYNMEPGKWRVNIKTEQNQLIGRLRFNVVKTDTKPILSTMIK